MNKLTFTLLLFLTPMTHYGQTLKGINTQTIDFIQTLSSDQLNKINYAFEDTSRTYWTNLPIGLADRPGLRYGELTEQNRIAFHSVLTTILSSQGYLKITSIMRLDDILNEIFAELHAQEKIPKTAYEEIKNLAWDYGNFYIAIWGVPGSKEPWGLKFEGHHISINLSASDGGYTMTPLFLGTDPAEVRITKFAGLRILNKEEDFGYKLIGSLTAGQQSIATLSGEIPRDIITSPQNPQRIDEYQGIKGGALNPKQKYLLERLILEYVNNLGYEKAHAYQEKIMSNGMEDVYFAWIGSYVPNESHYYIINSPSFMIEFDNYGGRSANHIHTIWREKGNDFGEDLLRQHYTSHPHN